MNSANRKTSAPNRLLLNLSDKLNLTRSDKYVTLLNVSTYSTLIHTKTINLKYQF